MHSNDQNHFITVKPNQLAKHSSMELRRFIHRLHEESNLSASQKWYTLVLIQQARQDEIQLSKSEMARALKVSVSQVENLLSKLKALRFIDKVAIQQKGGWQTACLKLNISIVSKALSNNHSNESKTITLENTHSLKSHTESYPENRVTPYPKNRVTTYPENRVTSLDYNNIIYINNICNNNNRVVQVVDEINVVQEKLAKAQVELNAIFPTVENLKTHAEKVKAYEAIRQKRGEIAFLEHKLRMLTHESSVEKPKDYLNMQGDRAFSEDEKNDLLAKLDKLVPRVNRDLLANEIAYAVRFGALRKSAKTQDELSIERALHIALKLIRQNKWTTPQGYGR